MKLLYLTGFKRVLNEAAQKRLDDFEDSDEYEQPKDEYGRTAEFYLDQNISIPPELKENKSSDLLKFDLEKDYDEYEIEVVVNLDQFVMCVDDEEEGCTIYLNSGHNVFVLEQAIDVTTQIWGHSRSNWEKFKEYISKLTK